jgi:hypothetical protein
MKKLIELNASIDAWAVKNGLEKLKESDQELKIIEEIGELARAILKKDIAGQKDAIGDIYIALRVYALQKTWNIDNEAISKNIPNVRVLEFFHYFHTETNYALMFNIRKLVSLSENSLNLNFTDCVEIAFNEVKDRNLTIFDGVAVKEDKTFYLVQDVDNGEYVQCSSLKEVNNCLTNIKDDLHEGYDGATPFGVKINIYQLIETNEFVTDVSTSEEDLGIGMWETKKAGGENNSKIELHIKEEIISELTAKIKDLEKELEAYKDECDIY